MTTPFSPAAARSLCEQATPIADWTSAVWFETEGEGVAAIGPIHGEPSDTEPSELPEPGGDDHRRAQADAAFILAAACDEVDRLKALLGEACGSLRRDGGIERLRLADEIETKAGLS